MADTLLDVATEELQKATNEQARVGAELIDAQKDLDTAQAALDDAGVELKQLNEEADAIRRQIAEETVSADGAKLFEDLDAKTTEIRAKQAEIIGLQEDVADARGRLSAGRTEAAAAAAGAKASQVAQGAETARKTANAASKAAVTSAPLSGLPAAADVAGAVAAALPTKAARDAAHARLDEGTAVDGDIPKEVFARAEQRWNAQLARLAAVAKQAVDAEDQWAKETAKAGLAGTSAKAKLAFERSESALNDYALTGVARRDRALALLAGVKASTKLNAVEKARLHALRDAAVTANAFALEKALDDAQDKLEKKQDEIAAKRLSTLAADPTKDPDTDAAVAALVGDLPALRTAVTTAQGAYSGAPKKALDALEAAVPAKSWALFNDYESALVLLADLKAVKPNQLKTDFDAAEEAYAKALRAEQDCARAVLAVGGLAQERADRVDAVSQTRSTRLLQALRGDD
jgi:hypothetical protein